MMFCFFLLRVVTGITTLLALGILVSVVLLQNFFIFAKQFLGVFKVMFVLLASAFQKAPQVKGPTGLDISWLQITLMVVFGSMFISLFLPRAKEFIHVVAVMTAIATCWCLWNAITTTRLERIYLPFLGMWFPYYFCCLLQAGR